MSIRFETFTGEDGQTYARILGGNGEPMFVGEGHPDPSDAEDSITTVVQAVLGHDFQVDFSDADTRGVDGSDNA